MKKRRIRLKDIADRAGVSVSTVSLVLNGKALEGNVSISNSTVRKVHQIAVEMNYLSHGIIGLIVPSIRIFFIPMIEGVMEVLQKGKYSLAMGVETKSDFKREIEEIRVIEDKGFDCLIMLPTYELLKQLDDGASLFQNSKRVVFMNRFTRSRIPYVTVDQERCGYMAAKHLLEQGHRRIAFVGEHYPSENDVPPDPTIDSLRFRGYFRAMKEYDQTYISVKYATDLFDLNEEITSAYCARNQGAIELLAACWDHGLRVPDDLSIVGQDDTWEKEAVRPRLTAINVHEKQVGIRSAQAALALIEGGQPESVILEPELILRDSTRPLGTS